MGAIHHGQIKNPKPTYLGFLIGKAAKNDYAKRDESDPIM